MSVIHRISYDGQANRTLDRRTADAKWQVVLVKEDGSGTKKVTVSAPEERDALREAEAQNPGWECKGRGGDVQKVNDTRDARARDDWSSGLSHSTSAYNLSAAGEAAAQAGASLSDVKSRAARSGLDREQVETVVGGYREAKAEMRGGTSDAWGDPEKEETEGRHGYDPKSVEQAIASSRKPIGGKEAKAIHSLLRGRTSKDDEPDTAGLLGRLSARLLGDKARDATASSPEDLAKAKEEGRKAAARGKKRNYNFYVSGTPQSKAWTEGWEEELNKGSGSRDKKRK